MSSRSLCVGFFGRSSRRGLTTATRKGHSIAPADTVDTTVGRAEHSRITLLLIHIKGFSGINLRHAVSVFYCWGRYPALANMATNPIFGSHGIDCGSRYRAESHQSVLLSSSISGPAPNNVGDGLLFDSKSSELLDWDLDN